MLQKWDIFTFSNRYDFNFLESLGVFSSAQESFSSDTFSKPYSKFNLIVSLTTLVKTHTSEAPWVYNC